MLQRAAGGSSDLSDTLTNCLSALPDGARLELPPGSYRLERPVAVRKPITITTQGLSSSSPGCGSDNGHRCAVLTLAPLRGTTAPDQMPFLIAADGVSLLHLVIRGDASSKAFCGSEQSKASGGGIRVTGSRFTLDRSAITGIACYSALEITSSAVAPTVTNSWIAANGTHGPDRDWSDGMTVHDSRGATVENNLFTDNTDVQLIFGGCLNCRIVANRFRNDAAASRGSFAALMLHSWPNTSGQYAGTVVERNDIDCGPSRNCGFGLMIGSAPWYRGRMAGARISGNRVRNAMIGIDVDGLTGPIELAANEVASSGGTFRSTCGTRHWPGINIAPASRRFIHSDLSAAQIESVDTGGCLLNYPGR